VTLDRRPTIVDVARAAGVSRSLVSLVLQNPAKVSPTRKAAVHEAMRTLGYRPNRAARSLAQRRTDTIGVLVSDLHNPFYTEVLDGIEEIAVQSGYQVLIAAGGRNSENEKGAADTFIELRTDGIIMITPRLTNRQIGDFASLIPTVVVGRPGVRPPHCSSVHTDDAAGIELALDHLWQLGHRRIAHVSAGDGPGAKARESGYLEAMRRRGLGDAVHVARAEPNESGGYHGALELLNSGSRPTAIVASNDFAAVGVLSALAELGLSSPHDVSVVGYDNSILAHLQPVSLTSVNQPRIEMGRAAAEMLRALVGGEKSTTAALLPSLVIRKTTAAPRANG
jgi:DNA-binding LacI/PurR family transcriptional regulator